MRTVSISLPPQTHMSFVNPYASPVADPTPSSPLDNGWEEMVMNGRRLVIYPYVFSIVVMTLRRNMAGVHVVETGKWPMGQLMGASLITSLFGWWGLPFGIIWSFINLFHLWNGGRDLTKSVLTEALGKQEAKRILAIAPKPKPPGLIWVVRFIILIPLLAILSFMTFIILDNGKI